MAKEITQGEQKKNLTLSRCTATREKQKSGRAMHRDESKASPNHSPLSSASTIRPVDNTLFKCSPLFQLADLSLASIPSLDTVRDYTLVTLFLEKKQEKVK